MAAVTKDTIIGDILDMDKTTAPFFMEMGMHCLGCPASRGETLEQACMVHGVDAEEMVKKLNAHMEGKYSATGLHAARQPVWRAAVPYPGGFMPANGRALSKAGGGQSQTGGLSGLKAPILLKLGGCHMPHPLFTLGARLSLCASMVRKGTKLADIGTDHAYLPVWLARQGLISHAIAADVRELPLHAAEKNIRRYRVEGQVSARLSDGLDAIFPNEADDVVMAGMGGELIMRLIAAAPWLRQGGKRMILQPMTSAEELRRFLEQEGFAVLREEAAAEDGHVYSVMQAAYDPPQAGGGPLYPYLGKLDGSTPERRMYIEKCAGRLAKKARGLEISGHPGEAEALWAAIADMRALCEKDD